MIAVLTVKHEACVIAADPPRETDDVVGVFVHLHSEGVLWVFLSAVFEVKTKDSFHPLANSLSVPTNSRKIVGRICQR